MLIPFLWASEVSADLEEPNRPTCLLRSVPSVDELAILPLEEVVDDVDVLLCKKEQSSWGRRGSARQRGRRLGY